MLRTVRLFRARLLGRRPLTFGFGIRRPSAPCRLAAHDYTCDRDIITLAVLNTIRSFLSLTFFLFSRICQTFARILLIRHFPAPDLPESPLEINTAPSTGFGAGFSAHGPASPVSCAVLSERNRLRWGRGGMCVSGNGLFFCNILQFVGGLVLGCIKMNVCKKICA